MQNLIFAAILLAGFSSHGNARISKATLDSLKYMKSVYENVYAPAPWKSQYDQWDIEGEYQAGISQIQQKSANLSVDEGRRILMNFVYSMRDYHVSIRFFSTEESTLPFTVRSAEGRYFIVHIDKEKLGEEIFPFKVGDEIVSFNGKPINDEIEALKITELNVSETDQALAELSLTSRRASRGHKPVRGPVEIGIKKADSDQVNFRQLVWNYTPEMIMPLMSQDFGLPKEKQKPLISSPLMEADTDTTIDNPHGLGHKAGYLPNLGEPIWNSSDEDPFRSYIYRSDKGEMIGVIRIPAYSLTGDKDVYDKHVEFFAQTIERMEKVTDKLVIDQLNNPGGSVFYLYALASTLSPTPLKTPRHRMSVTPQEVGECVNTLKELEKVTSDETAQKEVGKTIHGYPVTLQFVQFYKEYCKLYIDEWNAGKTMTKPHWIAGVDQINPYKNTYSKPILVLVNELDFSGGDFFPTILQDNKRAKIMGVRTAGAGGYVLGYQFPNLLGVDTFRVTQSLAYRVSENPIENLGVKPDIDALITVKDRQSNYGDYIKAVKEALGAL